jgi:hypothetical protein
LLAGSFHRFGEFVGLAHPAQLVDSVEFTNPDAQGSAGRDFKRPVS